MIICFFTLVIVKECKFTNMINIKGDIYFDNINFKESNKQAIRRQLGVVPQDICLFNKSILDNIIRCNYIKGNRNFTTSMKILL